MIKFTKQLPKKMSYLILLSNVYEGENKWLKTSGKEKEHVKKWITKTITDIWVRFSVLFVMFIKIHLFVISYFTPKMFLRGRICRTIHEINLIIWKIQNIQIIIS